MDLLGVTGTTFRAKQSNNLIAIIMTIKFPSADRLIIECRNCHRYEIDDDYRLLLKPNAKAAEKKVLSWPICVLNGSFNIDLPPLVICKRQK